MIDSVTDFIFSITSFGCNRNQMKRLVLDTVQRGTLIPHPYGFFILRSFVEDEYWQLRIHLWPSQARERQNPDWPIHTHAGSLHSLILHGEVHNSTYRFHESVEGEGAIYEVSHQAGSSTMTKTAVRGEMYLTSRKSIGTGQRYCVQEGEFHTSDVDDHTNALTLVLLELQPSSKPRVFGDEDGPTKLIFDRTARKNIEDSDLRAAIHTMIF